VDQRREIARQVAKQYFGAMIERLQVGRCRRCLWLFQRALVVVYEENGLGIAKGAAFSGLLAFFPVLTTIALILARFKAEQVAGVIARFLFEVVPPGTEQLVMRRFTTVGEKPASLLVFAGFVALWAASGLIVSLEEGFNAVYRVPTPRPAVRGRLVAFGLVFATALPVLGASALVVLGARVELTALRLLGVLAPEEEVVGWVLALGTMARYAVAVGTVVLVMGILYKVGPNRPQQWSDVWPGALVATGLWLLATVAFSWYVRDIADYNVFYGSVGAVIALAVWMYLFAVIALLGCAYNAERERLQKVLEG